MNKIINSTCKCGLYISAEKEVLAIIPCEHLMHRKCVKKITNYKCPYCEVRIRNILSYNEVKRRAMEKKSVRHYQLYVDMTAIKNEEYMGEIEYGILPMQVLLFMELMARYTLINTKEEFLELCKEFRRICNMRIRIYNREKLSRKKKIIISNHSNQIDPLVIVPFIECGFIVSSILNKNSMGRSFVEIYPTVVVTRGEKGGVVDKMKMFMKKNENLCIFPEGVVTHPNTIARFRTGAFKTGYPVQPIVIKYDPDVYSYDSMSYISKLLTQRRIDVAVTVLDLEYPPFTEQKIERIRNKMAYEGNMALSRVSNRDIVDRHR